MDNNFNFFGYEWMSGAKWGNTHPDCPNAWYSQNCIISKNSNLIELTVQKDCRNIKEGNNRYVELKKPFDKSKPYKQYGIGLIRTIDEFGFGTFEIECTLPKGCNLWPSFWFSSDTSWPPEIDVFEGYTDNNGSYRKGLFKKRIESNVHYNGNNKEHLQIRPKAVCRRLIKDGKNIFKLEWNKDKIEIFYNGKSVRKITDKKILNDFNRLKLHPIMNLMINPSFKDNDLSSNFIINNFKYVPF